MSDEIKFYNYGGQINFSKDNSTISAYQKNNLKNKRDSDIDEIIKSIEKDLYNLRSQDATLIKEILSILKEELNKSEPKELSIRHCISMLAPMITIVNGFPVLCTNIKTLIDHLQVMFFQ